jgi:single-stranded-DNA-specific exonuclease
MYDELTKCADLLEQFGGHPMAAGLSLKEENVEIFRKKINELCTLTEEELARKIVIDVPMPISYVNRHLVQELSLLEPFGKGNTKPLFAQKGLQVVGGKIFGKNQNVARVQLRDTSGYLADAIYFGDAAQFLAFAGKHEKISVTYYPEINQYQGRDSLQMVIKNYC